MVIRNIEAHLEYFQYSWPTRDPSMDEERLGVDNGRDCILTLFLQCAYVGWGGGGLRGSLLL